jgi:hypothetical protein
MATGDEVVRGFARRSTSTHRSSHDRPEGGAARDGPSKMSLEVTGMRAIAVVGRLGIVGSFLAWQGLGLVRGPEWPTMSDFFRSFQGRRRDASSCSGCGSGCAGTCSCGDGTSSSAADAPGRPSSADHRLCDLRRDGDPRRAQACPEATQARGRIVSGVTMNPDQRSGRINLATAAIVIRSRRRRRGRRFARFKTASWWRRRRISASRSRARPSGPIRSTQRRRKWQKAKSTAR